MTTHVVSVAVIVTIVTGKATVMEAAATREAAHSHAASIYGAVHGYCGFIIARLDGVGISDYDIG